MSLGVSLFGLVFQVRVAMEMTVDGSLSSSGEERSAFLGSHDPMDGDSAAVSALQLQGKEQKPISIIYVQRGSHH